MSPRRDIDKTTDEYKSKRERNRIAVKKCRQKQKADKSLQNSLSLINKLKEQKKIIAEKDEEINALRGELRNKLKDHLTQELQGNRFMSEEELETSRPCNKEKILVPDDKDLVKTKCPWNNDGTKIIPDDDDDLLKKKVEVKEQLAGCSLLWNEIANVHQDMKARIAFPSAACNSLRGYLYSDPLFSLKPWLTTETTKLLNLYSTVLKEDLSTMSEMKNRLQMVYECMDSPADLLAKTPAPVKEFATKSLEDCLGISFLSKNSDI